MNKDKIYAESIANEYDAKAIQLRKLYAKVQIPSTIFTYTLGIVAALIFALGMCLAMNVIGTPSKTTMALGIAIGIIGAILMGINYPVYKKLRERRYRKYASDIIRLAKEINEDK